MANISTSIIIATYNRAQLLGETLQSLAHSLSGSSGVEVVVVDTTSKDETRNVVEKFSNTFAHFRHVTEANQGLSYARNRGIAEARGSVLVFLDDDVEVDASWLPSLLAPLDDPSVAVVGGKVLPFGAQVIPEWLPREYCFLASVFDPVDAICELPKVMGGNSAVRRSVFDDVGLYDVSLGRKGKKLLGGEEIELQIRIRNAGHKIIYTPHAAIWHKIAEKLNFSYIENYAYWLGVGDAAIEKATPGRVKYILKVARSLVFPWVILPVQRMLSSNDAAAPMRYTIKRNYARGYLSHAKALADSP
jgi:glucosyl-dolichyl phosphate glucuronosyltransferase